MDILKLSKDYAEKQGVSTNAVDYVDQQLALIGVNMTVFQTVLDTLDKIDLINDVKLFNITSVDDRITINAGSPNFNELEGRLYDVQFRIEENQNLKSIKSDLEIGNTKLLRYNIHTEQNNSNPVLELYIRK